MRLTYKDYMIIYVNYLKDQIVSIVRAIVRFFRKMMSELQNNDIDVMWITLWKLGISFER